MSKLIFPLLTLVPLVLASCATPPPPPQVYHPGASPALVIDAIDATSSSIVQPAALPSALNALTLAGLKARPHQALAVVILENYREAQIGDEFRNRSVPWFVNLRSLGYEHIVFLQGNGSSNPDGLTTLVKYD